MVQLQLEFEVIVTVAHAGHHDHHDRRPRTGRRPCQARGVQAGRGPGRVCRRTDSGVTATVVVLHHDRHPGRRPGRPGRQGSESAAAGGLTQARLSLSLSDGQARLRRSA